MFQRNIFKPMHLLSLLLLFLPVFEIEAADAAPITDKADIVAKAQIVVGKVSMYANVAGHDMNRGNIVISQGSPIGRVISNLKKGDLVDILKVFPNSSESKYTPKIKTKEGKTGHITRKDIRVREHYGDKGALIAVHLSAPYEYEGDIEAVDADIAKLNSFVENYPASKYIPEALAIIAGLNIYALQLPLSREAKLSRVQQNKRIYKKLSGEINIARSISAAAECLKFLSTNEAEFSKSEVDPDKQSKLSELNKKLEKSATFSLDVAKDEVM